MTRTIRQTTTSEREMPGGRQAELELRGDGGAVIQAILQLPSSERPVPAVLLLHGFTSRKEVLSESVGRRLLTHGIASLAIDLPLHGARAGTLDYRQAMQKPLELLRHWKEAIAEARLAIGYLRARPEVDAGRIGIVGYSLGSHVGAAVTAADPRVRAFVVAAGGDLPTATPISLIARTVADPVAAIRRVAGRPVLFVHGRNDRTVLPDQAERLYRAAGEPKEIRWYDAGHRLPVEALDYAGEWLERTLAD
jgi:uncharacterized protein